MIHIGVWLEERCIINMDFTFRQDNCDYDWFIFHVEQQYIIKQWIVEE